MYQKKKMLLRNSKKHKKHMQYYLMQTKENNMTNSDIMHLIQTVVDSQDLKVSILEACQIFLKIYLVVECLAVLLEEIRIDQLKVKIH